MAVRDSQTTIRQALGLYGQLVIGPPGSGKTTYCAAMSEFLTNRGRKVHVINLDPANENLPYTCSVNLSELIRLDEVMVHLKLGPNGGLVYCMDYLYDHRDWLADQLEQLQRTDPKCYLIFDCPGQVELYTHHPATRQLVEYLTANPTHTSNPGISLHLTAVHLVDSHYCADPGKFIACLLTSLATMLHFSLPHVNVLSKADLIEQFGELRFNLDYFTEVLDLKQLIDCIDSDEDPFMAKYQRLNRALISLIEDRGLVHFLLLDIQDSSLLERVARFVDRANGYVFGLGEQEHNLQSLIHSASGVEIAPDWVGMAQEKYMPPERDVDESEQKFDWFA